MPVANTPRILALKKRKCRKIVIYSLGLSLILFLLFLVSIHPNPPAPFPLSISLLLGPVVIFFVALLLYYHVKLFPEFDFSGMSQKQIDRLAVNPAYPEACRKLRRKKLLKFLLIVLFVFIALAPPLLEDILPGFSQVLEKLAGALELLSTAAVVLLTRSLTLDVKLRRELEYHKYMVQQ